MQVDDAADAGEQTGQVEDAYNAREARVGQADDAGDNNHLPCVNLSTASGGVCPVFLIGVTHRTQVCYISTRSID